MIANSPCESMTSPRFFVAILQRPLRAKLYPTGLLDKYQPGCDSSNPLNSQRTEDGLFGIEQSSGDRASILTGNPNHRGSIQALTVKKAKQPRCPYCVLDAGFRPMKVLSNGRQICETCGHIIFPDDKAFRCPCQKCLDVNLSPRIRRLRRL